MIKSYQNESFISTPILFLIFNRPETTALVFEAIRKSRPPRLYVAADGPREDREGEADRVAKVREIVTAVDWPCEVKTLFQSRNLGCKYAVSTAIDWFFQHEEAGIILEDDVLPEEGFFYFCQAALNEYRDDPRVGFVAGHSLESKRGELNNGYETKFTTNALVWGWATWRRVWKQYDVELTDWSPREVEFLSQKKVSSQLFIDMWRHIFTGVKSGELNSWAYPLMYMLYKRNFLCLMPPYNLVDNIGFGADATHTSEQKPAWFIKSSDIKVSEVIFTEPKLDIKLDRKIMKKIYRITIMSEFKNFIKNFVKYKKL